MNAPSRLTADTVTVAETYLSLLASRGIDYLIANAGTDFAPVVEAMAKAQVTGAKVPKAITAVHENVAVAMAHGYAMVSGRMAAVMVHVSVGTANGVCAITNAARENVPVLFTAGRTPIVEEGLPGARDLSIHWGQEMFDQAGLVREFVKWDYELRNAEQVEAVVDRALSIAQTEPKGPVYLSLPREVLAAPASSSVAVGDECRRVASAPAAADPVALAEVAAILKSAKNPLIITANAGRDPKAVAVLADFAERFAIPVVSNRGRYLNIPADHPMYVPGESRPHVAEADAILVLECDVPWIPSVVQPAAACKVVHLGHDPLFTRYPIRGFRCDLALTAAVRTALPALAALLDPIIDKAGVECRRTAITAVRAAFRKALSDKVEAVRRATPIHPAWVSHCIAEAKDDAAIVVNEYTLLVEHCGFNRPGGFFASSNASGLGWGLGAALGAKLAEPDRLVIATLGDGAYMFANPVAGHYAARQNSLPILTVVFNNAMWNAVRKATLGMYPDGYASRANAPAYTHLDDLPAFDEVCRSAGGYGERVERPEDLPAALNRALAAVRGGQQALLNVICQAP